METITHKRPSTVTDGDGNAVPGGALTTVQTLQGLVAPIMADEPRLVGRSAVEVNFNLYFPAAVDSGILPDDVLTVRGVDCPVDGRICPWLNVDGEPAGTQVQVRLVLG